MTKDILLQRNARAQLGAGVDSLANAVKVTLGPRGRHVMLDRAFGPPTVTKDGATVAAEIDLPNPFADLGAQMVEEVASRTSDVAGDETTTAIVLAQAIYSEGLKLVAAGASPVDLKRGVDAAVAVVVAQLAEQSRPTRGSDEIARVGAISANGDEVVGALIADAMERVGREGVVTVEEATSMETTLEIVEGMQLDRGFLSPYFVTDAARMEAVLDEPFVLVCESKISGMQSLLPLLEQVVGSARPLLIVADDVHPEALATLVVNHLRGALAVCAVKAPGFGDRRKDNLADVAVLTGTRVVSDELGIELEDLTLEDLGGVRRVTVDEDHTTLVDGHGPKGDIAARVRQLRAQLEDVTSEHDREALEQRLAKLAGGVAVLRLGAATETELKEKRARVEDALRATRAAVEEGVVPGGGVALVRCLPALEELRLGGDRQLGVRIIRRAIEAPLRRLVENAGLEGALVVARVREGEGGFGYDVAAERYVDLFEAGVIDPTKVVRVALQSAASVAALMLGTEAAIVTRPTGRRGRA